MRPSEEPSSHPQLVEVLRSWDPEEDAQVGGVAYPFMVREVAALWGLCEAMAKALDAEHGWTQEAIDAAHAAGFPLAWETSQGSAEEPKS